MAEEPEKPCLWCSILTENRRKLCFWRVPHGFKLAVLIASSNPLPWQWEAWLESQGAGRHKISHRSSYNSSDNGT